MCVVKHHPLDVYDWYIIAFCIYVLFLTILFIVLLANLLFKFFRGRPTPKEQQTLVSASYDQSPLLCARCAESEAAEQKLDEKYSPTHSTAADAMASRAAADLHATSKRPRISLLNPPMDDSWTIIL
ncbi:hypothetical protein BU16DRAFT_526168 [Lophium mytilinum]|uniref:Uncharacterized protein n=1 Tax=Lophium mytilinum TaxID=390894 RepID=A0A6A6QZW1_9PEZI|nr:hypothetical protein BU16DRAFT_526168 [Lophium mytilinum]